MHNAITNLNRVAALWASQKKFIFYIKFRPPLHSKAYLKLEYQRKASEKKYCVYSRRSFSVLSRVPHQMLYQMDKDRFFVLPAAVGKIILGGHNKDHCCTDLGPSNTCSRRDSFHFGIVNIIE